MTINYDLTTIEWCTYEENNNYGTCRERANRTKKGRFNTKKSKPVLQFTLNGEFVCEWPSMSEAARNGFSIGNIWSCCRGRLKSAGGFIWKYKEVI